MSRQFNRRGSNASERKPFCKVCCDAGKSEKEYTSHFVKDRDGEVTCPTLLNQECRYCFRAGHTVKFCPVLKEREQEKEQYAKKCARADKERVVLEMVKAEKSSLLQEKAPLCGGAFSALADDSDSDEASPRATAAYKKGQAYFEHLDLALAMEFPGAARFCRANGMSSLGAILLNRENPKPKTQEEEFPALSANVTLRPHQQHFAAEGASFAATLQKPKPQPKAAVQQKQLQVVVPVVQRDAWSDDEDSTAKVAPLLTPAPAPLKRILNWADYDSSDDEDDEPYFSDGDSRRNR